MATAVRNVGEPKELKAYDVKKFFVLIVTLIIFFSVFYVSGHCCVGGRNGVLLNE